MRPSPPRVALVTGATTGIGRATAVEFARRGYAVVANYPGAPDTIVETVQQACAAAAEAARGGSCAGLKADVTREADVVGMVAEVAQAYGRLDVLVNNAGIQRLDAASHLGTAEDFDAVLAVNLRGAFLASREAIKVFLDQVPAGPRTGRGVIVNVSSVHQTIPRPRYLSYAVSKAGLKMMTETLALEYAGRGVRVVGVAPGATRTPIQSWLDDEAAQAVVEGHIPLGRVAEPDEIARTIAFAASDDAGYITGHTIVADGGLTLYNEFAEPWSG